MGSHFPKPIVFNELSLFYEAKTFIDLNVGRGKSGALIEILYILLFYFLISDVLCGFKKIQEAFCSAIFRNSFNIRICSVEQISLFLCLLIIQSILRLRRNAHNPRQLYLPSQAASCWRSRVSINIVYTNFCLKYQKGVLLRCFPLGTSNFT